MEDNLKKIRNGRRPQTKKWKTTSKKKNGRRTQNLKKKMKYMNNNKNGRRPKKKWKLTSNFCSFLNEDNIKNKICSQFLLNLGQTFPGIGSALCVK
jgi:hypothetical protein